MFNKMFDFNHDGKLDAAERAMEYMKLRSVIGEDETGDDEIDFEDEDYDGGDDF